VKRNTPDTGLQAEAPFDPTGFILPRPDDAWVERRVDGGLVIRWRVPAVRAGLWVTADPDAATGLLSLDAPVDLEARCAIVETLPDALAQARPYFRLDLDDRRLVVAERALPLGNGVNFRDIGGYPVAGGRHIRWGRIYRSGSLADLTDDDVDALARLGLRLSCDLRTDEEVAGHPDRLPDSATPFHRPIVAQVSRLRRVVALYRKRRRLQELLAEAYTVMLDQNGAVFADLFRVAADPANLPLVIHCTAGKDRTGLAVALLLHALGASDEVILADYTLSNTAFDILAGRMRPEMERLYALGFGETQVRPFLLAEARTLESALAYVRKRYGSVESYLAGAGVTPETVDALRQNLLV